MSMLKKALLTLVFAFGAMQAVAQAAAPTVSLTVSPNKGTAPLSVTLTWSTTGAAGCTASGGWTGTQPTSGTQSVQNITSSTTFTLTCTGSNGQALIAWTAPTVNTDGSTLTNLSGFNVYRGTSATALTLLGTTSATTLTYTDTNLAAGTYYYAVTALAGTVESPQSKVVNKTITIASASASSSVTILPVPNPPGNVTVT